MAFDADRVEAITFDSFTTLVDVHGPTRTALAEFVDDPEPVATLWRSRAVAYRMVATFVDRYEPYTVTTREALEYALSSHGVELSEESTAAIAGTFDDLPVFDDVAGTVRRLDEAGYDLYILSNGERAQLESIVDRAGIHSYVSATIGADEIGAYKPSSAIYEHAAARTATPVERIAHVAAPWYDIYGAMGAGMQGVWVNRDDRPWDTFDGDPDLSVDSLTAVARAFDA